MAYAFNDDKSKYDLTGLVNSSKTMQSQIVPKAAVESSTTASQAYTAGQYVVVAGVLRRVTSAIARGNTISDSNSTATTIAGEFASFAHVESKDSVHKIDADDLTCFYVKRNGIVYLSIVYIKGHTSDLTAISSKMPAGYRPISGFEPYFPIGYEGSNSNRGLCKIYSDGTISTISSTNDAYYAGAVSYPVE